MRYRQRQSVARQRFLWRLRRWIKQLGLSAIVYSDESGFEPDAPCLYAWSPWGHTVYGERHAQRRLRENLIAARCRGEWLSPLLLQGRVTAAVFETWLKEHLLLRLQRESVLVLDNAPFHRPAVVTEIMESAGHHVLFLPPYSPDFNKIEGDFAALKKIRSYADESTSLDEIVAAYRPNVD